MESIPLLCNESISEVTESNILDRFLSSLNSGLPGIGINNIVNQYNVITNPINSIASNFNIGGGSGLPSIGGGGGY